VPFNPFPKQRQLAAYLPLALPVTDEADIIMLDDGSLLAMRELQAAPWETRSALELLYQYAALNTAYCNLAHPTVAFHIYVCRELADRSGFVVVGISYRLAPGHPFPAGIEDCQDVFTWMAKERPGGLDPERLAVGGESAGGNFTTALALWARDTNGPRIAHHAPIYPLTDFTMKLVAWEEGNKGNPGVTPEVADEVRRTYLPDGDLENPMASVLFADHTGLPPALVVTCEHDILRNEGVALAESYVKAGVETRHLHMDDQPHGYLLMTRLTKRSYETIDAMIAEANKHL